MAIGSGCEGAETTLQEEYKADISLPEAELLALSTLKQVMEEKVGCAEGLVLSCPQRHGRITLWHSICCQWPKIC